MIEAELAGRTTPMGCSAAPGVPLGNPTPSHSSGAGPCDQADPAERRLVDFIAKLLIAGAIVYFSYVVHERVCAIEQVIQIDRADCHK